LTQNVRFGRLPNDPTKPRLRLGTYQVARPTPPPTADWVTGVHSWPMSLNDSIGDCTAAGAGHIAQLVNWYGRQQDAPVTDADVLKMYEAISGYNPSDPTTDVGATLQDALGYWRKTGIGGNTIAAFAQIDHTDLAMVRDCIALFGAVYCGLTITQTAMDEFDAGQPWTSVAASQVLGGHCVPLAAYTPTTFTAITWGKPQPLSVSFYSRWFDEVWVPIDLDWLTAQGYSPGHLNTDQLNADFMALTGTPGPFPHGVTPPAPAPKPAPAPADRALAAAVRVWLTNKGL